MKPKTLSIVGLVITFIWIVASIIWAGQYNFIDLNLEEQAGYISGFVSFLAFLWLVLGYYQQGYEIKENTKALQKQYKELNEQRKAMENQAVSLSEAAESLREYNRPFLTAHFELKGSSERISFIVENIGIRPAYNAKFQFDPPLEEFAHYEKMEYDKFVNLEFIPPGYKKEYYISHRIREIQGEQDIDWKCKVSISYEDQRSNSFEEEYSMSFFDSHWKIYNRTQSIEESLEKMNELAKDLAQQNNTKK